MNTVKSFWIGWGSLCIAGAGAYYLAKKEINASRREKHLQLQRQKQLNAELEQSYDNQKPYTQHSQFPEHDSAGSPSSEASSDPAPTRHSRVTDSERAGEKSKYEASVPYQSPKGDRFS